MTDYVSDDFRLDFTSTPDQKEFGLIPRGKRTCQITDVSVSQTSESAEKYPEAPMINVEFTVADNSEFNGRKVWNRFIVAENEEEPEKSPLRNLKGLLGALGYDTSGPLNFSASDFVGEYVDAQIGVQKGKTDPRTGTEYADRNTTMSYYPHTLSDADMLS